MSGNFCKLDFNCETIVEHYDDSSLKGSIPQIVSQPQDSSYSLNFQTQDLVAKTTLQEWDEIVENYKNPSETCYQFTQDSSPSSYSLNFPTQLSFTIEQSASPTETIQIPTCYINKLIEQDN